MDKHQEKNKEEGKGIETSLDSPVLCLDPFQKKEPRKHGMQGLRELQQKQRRSRISHFLATRDHVVMFVR